ncbi:acetate--CoA ligase [Vibrio quintilis]|uniref:Acetyl-coenzyme A synthetase n=1 Tax=Vibrio quintilis TaxID=1117707 RepID=A0A1M7YZR6_9VIBR|nr:acetate--CoA ligase [Vibrio quintilis]SHO58042.1 Acetyl-coenzyme A synthetase [Vibrio quintilis]
MSDVHTYPVKKHIKEHAHVDEDTYVTMYQHSVSDPEGFWSEHGKIVDWIKPYSKVKNTSFDPGHVGIHWFEDGTLNVSENCIDRHLKAHGDEIALIWEGDDPRDDKTLTYTQLYIAVCRFANALKELGVRKGDVVCLYMPMVPEAAVAMLACTRIGAIHTVVFGGFSPEALAGRMIDSNAKIVITADEGVRGGRPVPLKQNVDEALTNPNVKTVEKVIVYQRTNGPVDWHPHRDVWWHDATALVADHCPPEEMKAEDPLFILYTSGSTGKPKGVLHTTGGYLVYATMTFKYIFDYQPGEVFWCTADVGWITGHTYLIYGPLSNRAKTILFEGVPNYPSTSRMSEVIDKHQVNILYTAPTAIRALMAKGDEAVAGTSRTSLRIMGSVGEPINPEAWEWYYRTIGNEQAPVVDTWWQTETGGILITPLPGATVLKPGSATRPFFGVQPALVDNTGNILEGEAEGNLVLLDSWPGQMRTVYGDHERFEQTYFSTFKGMYFTGDGARRDEDNDYWITGRVDDVLNVSGHRMGTAEVESALVAFDKIAEAAVVGIPHDIKGQAIYAYITLNDGVYPDAELHKAVKEWVRKEIGPIATPDVLHWADALPKTRSGKIMRRILRKIATGDIDNLGDTSTLADPNVVDKLIEENATLG